MAPTKERPATKTIATNREARHEYFVLEALETGVELKGTEVKSLRAGGVNLKDSWVDIEDGELLVKGMHISPYDHGNMFNQDPMRVRRLLAHKSEIRRLHQQCKLQGYTLVPLSLYFKHGRVKMEVGLCKGKKLYRYRIRYHPLAAYRMPAHLRSLHLCGWLRHHRLLPAHPVPQNVLSGQSGHLIQSTHLPFPSRS